MKRLLILVAVVALAMYVASRPVLAVAQHHGGHSGHHGGHSGGHIGHSGGHFGHSGGHIGHIGHSSHHIGHSVHRGSHVGHHTGHHGSSLHLSFGSGRHYSSYYGYRSPYRYSYSYSSPAYRSYSYPTYRRTYRYVNPSCYGPSVILIPPTQPKAEAAEEADDEQPEVDPAPEPVPALEPAPAAAPSAGTWPLAPGTIRYAVLRSQQPLPERATARQPAQLAPNRIAGATPQPSAAGSLGPRLAAPKVRSLISDDDVPWVAP